MPACAGYDECKREFEHMTTFVLIHGSYQGGWIWQRVASPSARRRAYGLRPEPRRLRRAQASGPRRHHHRDARRRNRRAAVLRGPERCRHGRHELGRHGAVPRRRSGARADRPGGLRRCAGAVRRRADPRHRPALDGGAERAHRRPVTRGRRNPAVCRSRPGDPRMGVRRATRCTRSGSTSTRCGCRASGRSRGRRR